MKNKTKVIVIGGGAAGFFGAIHCGITHPNWEIILLEATTSPLAKVKISGGGRCNVTHHCFDAAELVKFYPRGGKALRGAFTRFQPKDTVAWYEARGVKLKTESDGRIFPITDNSQTIIDCLLKAATDAGVKIYTGTPVKWVEKKSDKFEVILKKGNTLICDYLLITTGSNPLGYRWANALGHTIISPVPSLFTFKIPDPRLEELSGISVNHVNAILYQNEKVKIKQNGAILITHWGFSGPCILKLSAWGARIMKENNYKMSLSINWLPKYNKETLREYFLEVKSRIPRKKIIGSIPLALINLPKRLWQSLVIAVGIPPEKSWAELSKKELNRLASELTQGCFQIQGRGVFKEEFVTCGGVNLKEVNFKTMESKICPGLFFAGEILDIDGVTGGFNFQNAWTTSWLAGEGMGR